jgi:hypothetical protein
MSEETGAESETDAGAFLLVGAAPRHQTDT